VAYIQSGYWGRRGSRFSGRRALFAICVVSIALWGFLALVADLI